MFFQTVKGTRSFYPENMAFRNWLFNKMRKVSNLFGYQEYEGPILEPLQLYAAKSSEELVNEQTFIINDKSGQKICLRPELTPSLARMISEKQNEIQLPIRWFSIGPFWRYEQPQKGRAREFFQWNLDLLGLDLPQSDGEVIVIATELFKSLGLSPKEVKIKVNNRKYMDKKLAQSGIDKEIMPQVFKAIDKKEKMSLPEWEEYLSNIGLNTTQKSYLKKLLDNKDYSDDSEELINLFTTISELGDSEYIEFDPTIVRGLDYYTGTVFEARDCEGEFRSILGGGRYDNLVEIVGGKPISGIGFAAGDILLELLLKKYNKIPNLPQTDTNVLVSVFEKTLYWESLKIAKKIRDSNINTEIYLDTQTKLEKQLKYADSKGIPFVVILGPDELLNNTIIVKNMNLKTQEAINCENIVEYLKIQTNTQKNCPCSIE